VQQSAAVLAQHGVEVQVVAAAIEDHSTAPQVRVRPSPRLFDRSGSVGERLGIDVRDAGIELVHLHQVDDPLIVDALRPAAPVVISAHGFTACTSGVYYFEPGNQCTRGHGPGCVPNLMFRGCAHTDYRKTLPRKYRNATLGRHALDRADFAISYGTAVDRHLAANGVTARAIVPYFPTMSPRPTGGHEGRRRAVFAGRVVRPKGVGALLRAAVEVDAEFELCGDGRDLESMRQLAADLRISDRVTFRGWLGPDDLAASLAAASVVVMPSLWPEPFGLVGIEGFAAGRPAVASATGGIGDWLQDGVSGLTVPPGDIGALAQALKALLGDPARQAEMGAAGKAWVAERFTPERHVEALLDAYRRARGSWDQRRRLAA
jgi:glycosyltransferase involved in cell wall biosynthesis